MIDLLCASNFCDSSCNKISRSMMIFHVPTIGLAGTLTIQLRSLPGSVTSFVPINKSYKTAAATHVISPVGTGHLIGRIIPSRLCETLRPSLVALAILF